MNLLLLIVSSLFANSEYPVDILPDAPGYVYQQLQQDFTKDDSPVIKQAILAGNKNLNWLKYMNETRAADDQIALTKPGELTSYPIESPSIYNEKIIGDRYNAILAEIPAVMREIIFGNAPMTREPGLELSEYIVWAKKVDRVYQSANRWRLLLPNIDYYEMNSFRDVRGYYMLGKVENLSDKLNHFSDLDTETQALYKKHLAGMCSNASQAASTCNRQLRDAISRNIVNSFYQTYLPYSKKLWDSFFKIVPSRRDINWTSANPDVAVVPVRNTTPEIEEFLRVNIEDEWKWNDWHLRLNFTRNAAIHVEFQPNVTPHVSNSNTIVMDKNTPLTEWDVMWTIRHEFGHTLGFKDCYVEFYDAEAEAMVNYQLDVTNMMCSRAGTMQEAHYLEMKSVYLK
ncbi:MAG: hypothetical protein KDD37_00925 [Bdellovibrionales bacterium]|nr:hypothetical protein [Bdellovibrionales bacterium]